MVLDARMHRRDPPIRKRNEEPLALELSGKRGASTEYDLIGAREVDSCTAARGRGTIEHQVECRAHRIGTLALGGRRIVARLGSFGLVAHAWPRLKAVS